MQTISIDISDSGRVILEDRIYYMDKNSEELIRNQELNESAFFGRCYEDDAEFNAAESFEYNVVSVEKKSRGFRNIIYPTVLKKNGSLNEESVFFLFTELPECIFGNKIFQLPKALIATGFSIYSRIMAGINLAEAFSVLQKYIGENILSIHPQEIYINLENGEVYIIISKWLRNIDVSSEETKFGFSPEWYERDEKTFTEYDFRYFVAYSIFRLLCNDEPFDGSETLLKFPLLTKEAIRQMQGGKYEFALIKGNNYVSDYFGQGLLRKWCALPGFIRNEFERNFTEGMEFPEKRSEISQWLKTMQKLRDCLVNVNGQVRFCDPDVSNKVLFLAIDDYKIPVWPQKAIYWYHVDIPIQESKNGVVAGVTYRDGHYYLCNLSGDAWSVTLNKTTNWVHPEREIEIVEKMIVQLGNGKVVKVVNGLADNDVAKTVTVTSDDVNENIEDTIRNVSYNEDSADNVQTTDEIIMDLDGKVE